MTVLMMIIIIYGDDSTDDDYYNIRYWQSLQYYVVKVKEYQWMVSKY